MSEKTNTTNDCNPDAKAFEETEKQLRDDEQRLGDGATAQQSLQIEITRFTKAGGILSKKFSLGLDGKLKSDGSACRMWKGTAEPALLDGPAALVDFINGLKSNEALALGCLLPELPEVVRVVTKKELKNTTAVDTIARTADHLIFVEGRPAFILFDHDGKGMPSRVKAKIEKAGDVWSAITSVAPGFKGAARVIRASTSAGLYNRETEESFPGSTNQHIYPVVKDGSDIERTLAVLHDRSWLNGLGWMTVSKSGSILERSIIDASVGRPERMVFEGPPFCFPPVAQDQSIRRPKFVDGKVVDTREAVLDLTKAEKKRLREMKAEAEQQIKPQAEKVREAWAKDFAARRGLSVEAAERIIKAACEAHTLAPEFELEFDELGRCTVADVLAKPEKYIDEVLADPLEGVEYGRGKAKVLRRAGGDIFIKSFAHGGGIYQLGAAGVVLEDFIAYPAVHKYFYEPTGALWPPVSVNALFGEGASLHLDKTRAAQCCTWAPGHPAVIKDWLFIKSGWIERGGVATFNLYRPPTIKLGNAGRAWPWYNHVHKIYPADAGHIICWLAHCVQHPNIKINHAIVLGGKQGIGKDTILVPVRHAVGPWNFDEVSPLILMGRFNGFLKSVILRVSEARDQGEVNRFKFYDHLKSYTTAPPDTLLVDEKNLPEYYVPNVCGVIITTNYRTDAIYLPADDRRHYVAWSDWKKEDFDEGYWKKINRWYENGGNEHVAAYLNKIDITDFDPKAPPPKTQAFFDIVDAGRASEDAEFADALDKLATRNALGKFERPNAVLIADIVKEASDDFAQWLNDRKNRWAIPHRLEKCGYVRVHNTEAEDGLWKISGRRQAVYGRDDLSFADRVKAAEMLVKSG